uniref:Protein kinase domain-containing protein n=1 Tax=Macrostomum lignano TaxID=282301 RepID=A0A1I8FBY6_9PLAT
GCRFPACRFLLTLLAPVHSSTVLLRIAADKLVLHGLHRIPSLDLQQPAPTVPLPPRRAARSSLQYPTRLPCRKTGSKSTRMAVPVGSQGGKDLSNVSILGVAKNSAKQPESAGAATKESSVLLRADKGGETRKCRALEFFCRAVLNPLQQPWGPNKSGQPGYQQLQNNGSPQLAGGASRGGPAAREHIRPHPARVSQCRIRCAQLPRPPFPPASLEQFLRTQAIQQYSMVKTLSCLQLLPGCGALTLTTTSPRAEDAGCNQCEPGAICVDLEARWETRKANIQEILVPNAHELIAQHSGRCRASSAMSSSAAASAEFAASRRGGSLQISTGPLHSLSPAGGRHADGSGMAMVSSGHALSGGHALSVGQAHQVRCDNSVGRLPSAEASVALCPAAAPAVVVQDIDYSGAGVSMTCALCSVTHAFASVSALGSAPHVDIVMPVNNTGQLLYTSCWRRCRPVGTPNRLLPEVRPEHSMRRPERICDGVQDCGAGVNATSNDEGSLLCSLLRARGRKGRQSLICLSGSRRISQDWKVRLQIGTDQQQKDGNCRYSGPACFLPALSLCPSSARAPRGAQPARRSANKYPKYPITRAGRNAQSETASTAGSPRHCCGVDPGAAVLNSVADSAPADASSALVALQVAVDSARFTVVHLSLPSASQSQLGCNYPGRTTKSYRASGAAWN